MSIRPSEKEHLTGEEQEALNSLRLRNAVLPVLLGVGVVIYLFWRQYDPVEFAQIDWTFHTLGWILLAVLILIIRHLAYAYRLRILSLKDFSWRKCIQLIFIWEFSSAVSPTALGGSAVAFFVLAQEKLSTARTATIVLYTVVLDTAFFILSLPVLYLFFGTQMIRPDMQNWQYVDGWGITFIIAYVSMAIYGSLFAYGLFLSPVQIKRLLTGITQIGFLRRWQDDARKLGEDMRAASIELRRQPIRFHLSAFAATATAWSCRFLLLNCIIIAFSHGIQTDFFTQAELYARLETMFVIIAFSPTPGGAGFAEFLFKGFLVDYLQDDTQALIMASVWRLLTYYSYLLAGAIVIPGWLRGVMKLRRERRLAEEQAITDPQ